MGHNTRASRRLGANNNGESQKSWILEFKPFGSELCPGRSFFSLPHADWNWLFMKDSPLSLTGATLWDTAQYTGKGTTDLGLETQSTEPHCVWQTQRFVFLGRVGRLANPSLHSGLCKWGAERTPHPTQRFCGAGVPTISTLWQHEGLAN